MKNPKSWHLQGFFIVKPGFINNKKGLQNTSSINCMSSHPYTSNIIQCIFFVYPTYIYIHYIYILIYMQNIQTHSLFVTGSCSNSQSLQRAVGCCLLLRPWSGFGSLWASQIENAPQIRTAGRVPWIILDYVSFIWKIIWKDGHWWDVEWYS